MDKSIAADNSATLNGQNLLTHTLVDGTSMNEEYVAVDVVQPQVDRQVCAVRFLT